MSKCFNNLPPFKAFVLQNFPFIEEDFDALTYYEILCKIIEKLNLTAEQVEKINDILINMNIDDMIEEDVNAKLDEMAEDGTLEELINQQILGHKLDYYLVDNTITDIELQELFDIPRKKIIEFKNGNYNFTSTFRLNSNTKLICNSARISTTQNHLFFNFKDTDTDITEYNGHHNIEIKGGIFNSGFSFLHSKNVTIEDVYFYHCINDHCIEICASKNFTVKNCKFEGVLVQASQRQYVENVQIDTCNHQSFPWLPEGSLTFDGTPNMNVEICNCEFIQPSQNDYCLYTAIGSHNYIESAVHQNILIHDNTIANPLSVAIRLYNTKYVKIFNNDIYALNVNKNLPRQALAFYNGADQIRINNNFINGFSKHIYIADNSGYIYINNNMFRGCVNPDSEGNTTNVINFRGVIFLNITNNTFSNNSAGILYNYEDSTSTGTALNFSNNEVIMTGRVGNIVENRCRIYGTEKIIMNGNTIKEYETVNTGYWLRTTAKVEKLFISNNNLSNIDGNPTRFLSAVDYTGDFKNVYGVNMDGYTGNTEITGNQNLNVPFNNFNKMFVVCGGTNSTYTDTFYDFDPIDDKLQARSWIFSGWTANGESPVKCILTFNENGTFSFSSTESSYHLRRIAFCNEQ